MNYVISNRNNTNICCSSINHFKKFMNNDNENLVYEDEMDEDELKIDEEIDYSAHFLKIYKTVDKQNNNYRKRHSTYYN